MSQLLSNVRSVKGKLNDIQVLSSQFNIICLTETHLDSLVPNTMLFDAADKPVFMFERSLYGGGVLIACDYGLKCRQLDWDSQTLPVEVIVERYKATTLIKGDFNFPDIGWSLGIVKSNSSLKGLH